MKRLMMGMVFVAIFSGIANAGIDDGLVAYYPFEYNCNDSSRNNNHGKKYGSVTYSKGVVGMAAKFGGFDDKGYFKITNSETLKFSETATFSFWMKLNDTFGQTGRDCSVDKQECAKHVLIAKTNGRYGISIRTSEYNNRIILEITANSDFPNKSGARYISEIKMGNWIHFAIITGSHGTKIYSNGKLAKSSNDFRPTDFEKANAEDMYLGIQTGKGSCLDWWYPFNGELDEIRIYNRELTDTEINKLANPK